MRRFTTAALLAASAFLVAGAMPASAAPGQVVVRAANHRVLAVYPQANGCHRLPRGAAIVDNPATRLAAFSGNRCSGPREVIGRGVNHRLGRFNGSIEGIR